MAYTYEYPRPAVTADCVVITKGRLRVGAKAGMAEPKVLLKVPSHWQTTTAASR